MKYANTVTGIFMSRPNRFIAIVEVAGKEEKCHVKNTGRCRELLVPGAQVILETSDNPSRKTKYDVIAVYKGERLINMDSQAPNRVAGEYIKTLFPDITLIKPEVRYCSSRFDFYFERGDVKSFLEVKGVTLEENSTVLFPDAPTERGVKHVKELCRSVGDGYEAYILFVIQMKDVKYFTPNYKTHRAFGEALKKAASEGVNILAVDCNVTEDSLTVGNPVEIRL